MARTHSGRRQPGTLRIIAGRWRGRRLSLPAGNRVRPTGDRIRETLFNWLAADIRDARCLDLFAGSGALGIEALSRGAAQVTFVERDPVVVAALERNLERLGATGAEVVPGDAWRFLGGRPVDYDVVFLDPPFVGGIAAEAAPTGVAAGVAAEAAPTGVAAGVAAEAAPTRGLGKLCTLLAGGWLAAGGRVYLEMGRDQELPALPPGWVWLRDKTAGRVRFALAGVEA